MSERELLLLTNYAYFKCSVNQGTIGENIKALKNPDGSFNMDKVNAQGAIGVLISEDDAIDILKRLESNEKLSSLELREFKNEGDLRVALYTDKSGKDATMVFRGTGGTFNAWEDNVLGAYQEDTKIQKMAADFVKNECSEYKNITVTGHSKGGNLAQYVTVTCKDQIDKCVSYDGQGFGKEFLTKYAEDVKETSGRITCICGYNDFVNILLTPIGGTYLYVHNKEDVGVGMHSCYSILSHGIFDENGDFDRIKGVRSQAMGILLTRVMIAEIVVKINELPEDEREAAINLLGTIVGSFLSSNMSDEYERKRMEDALNAFKESLDNNEPLNETKEECNYMCQYLYINIENVKQCYERLDELSLEIKNYPVQIEDLLVNLEINIRGISFTEIALKKIVAKLDNNITMINKMKENLAEIIVCYEKADSVA